MAISIFERMPSGLFDFWSFEAIDNTVDNTGGCVGHVSREEEPELHVVVGVTGRSFASCSTATG